MPGLALILLAAFQQFDGVLLAANNLQAQESFQEAEQQYLSALKLAVKFGSDSHVTALTLNNLAALRHRMGRYDDAAADYQTALAIWRSTGNRKDLASALGNFAELRLAQARLAEGLPLVEEALAIQKTDGLPFGRTKLVYGNMLRSSGRLKEASALLREAVSDSPAVDIGFRAASLGSLAQTELAIGNHAEARKAANEAAEIWAAAKGKGSTQFGFALFLRSRALRAEGDLNAAESDVRETRSIFQATLGKNHPRLIPVLADLGELLGARNRYPEAVAMLTEALVISAKTLGEKHPDHAGILLAIANQHRAAGQFPLALAQAGKAVAGAQTAHGTDSPNLAGFLNTYGTILFESGDRQGAEHFFRRALAIREKHFGPMHVNNAETLQNLAIVCGEGGRYAEARKLVERSLAIRQHYYGATHPSLIAPLQVYANLLERTGDSKRSDQILAQASAIAGAIPENRHTVDVKTLRSFR